MQEISIALITLGSLMMLGLVTDLLGRHTPLPRVTMVIVTAAMSVFAKS